jgi:hypothetical protein
MAYGRRNEIAVPEFWCGIPWSSEALMYRDGRMVMGRVLGIEGATK